MDTLPKLLYQFQTIPILLPKQFFLSLCSMSIPFFWIGVSLVYATNCLPSPGYRVEWDSRIMNYTPKLLSQQGVLEWFPRPFTKLSIMVEQDLSPLDLRAPLWGYSQNLPGLHSSSLLTHVALHIWYRRGLQNLLSSDPSPLQPYSITLLSPRAWVRLQWVH